MARDRAQSGTRAANEARKRLERTIRPAEKALTEWIEGTAEEEVAHKKAMDGLAALVDAVGLDQAADLTELPAQEIAKLVRNDGAAPGPSGTAGGKAEAQAEAAAS